MFVSFPCLSSLMFTCTLSVLLSRVSVYYCQWCIYGVHVVAISFSYGNDLETSQNLTSIHLARKDNTLYNVYTVSGILHTLYNVYTVSGILHTLYNVYTVSGILHTLYNVYTVSGILHTLYNVYTVSGILHTLYNVYTVSGIHVLHTLYNVYTVSGILV